jgi:hydroxylaminobenzene mutase
MIWHGMFLCLLGLVTGLLERRFTNIRMGLAAHLVGVTNGTFLIALAAIWANVGLPPRAKAAAQWTALYGAYANWLFTTLAAVFGTAALSPITAAGHRGKPWQENVEKAGFLTVAVSIIASSVLVLWGLRQRVSSPPQGVINNGSSELGNRDMPLQRTSNPHAIGDGITP